MPWHWVIKRQISLTFMSKSVCIIFYTCHEMEPRLPVWGGHIWGAEESRFGRISVVWGSNATVWGSVTVHCDDETQQKVEVWVLSLKMGTLIQNRWVNVSSRFNSCLYWNFKQKLNSSVTCLLHVYRKMFCNFCVKSWVRRKKQVFA